MRPQSRKESQAETRQRLLESSRELFSEHGYHSMSMAAIAKRAGFTTGALYANFQSKADLFLAIVDEDFRVTSEATLAAVDGELSVESAVRAFAEIFEGRMRAGGGWNLAMVEFLASSRSDEQVLEQIRTRFTVFQEQVGSDIAAQVEAEGLTLTAPPGDIATLIYALDFGLTLAGCVMGNDEAVTDLYRRGVAAFVADTIDRPAE